MKSEWKLVRDGLPEDATLCIFVPVESGLIYAGNWWPATSDIIGHFTEYGWEGITFEPQEVTSYYVIPSPPEGML